MNKAPLIARVLLGLIFTVFGLNGFLNFIPVPPMPEAAGSFMRALVETGYMFVLIKATEVVCGVFLLIGRRVPLALTMLAPVVLNIVLFHVFLAPSPDALVLPLLSLVLGLYLAWAYRGSFSGVLKSDAQPG